MISTSDDEYKETKKIKLGEMQINPHFRGLAEWISLTWDTTVLNITHEMMTMSPTPRSRLQIIVEFIKDADKFGEEMLGDLIEIEEEKVVLKFKKIVQEGKLNYYTDDMFIIFSDFESIAMQESNENITDTEITELRDKLKIPDLWLIRRLFASVFLYVYEQSGENARKQRI